MNNDDIIELSHMIDKKLSIPINLSKNSVINILQNKLIRYSNLKAIRQCINKKKISKINFIFHS